MELIHFVITRVGNPSLHDFMLETICTIIAHVIDKGGVAIISPPTS